MSTPKAKPLCVAVVSVFGKPCGKPRSAHKPWDHMPVEVQPGLMCHRENDNPQGHAFKGPEVANEHKA